MNPAAETLIRVGLIGAATGLRSQWGVAALSWSTPPAAGRPLPSALLTGPWARALTCLTTAAEFVADKAPSTPSRLSAQGMGPRVVLGALAGAALAQRRGALPPLTAAATGVSTAVTGAFAGARWRGTARSPGRSVAVAAAAEDLLAAGLAWAACTSSVRRPPPAGDDEHGTKPSM
ncbi:DUF4126 family protein [Streptomyces coelicoflavus]|uniref:DUF4126 family protein n=1 Tax=Streptomyces coelicoflavus TaxID=285562 RepID=UPI003B97DE69